MPEITPIVAAVTMVLVLLGSFASFIGVKLDDPPKQHISPVTGYPTWHSTYEDYQDELSMSFTLVALLFTSFSAFVAWRATRSPSRSLTGWVSQDGREETSFQINLMIQFYIFVTWLAVVAYMFLDVGKIWAVVGALHNLLEAALLVLLVYGGRVTSMRYGLIMFTYVVTTIVLSEYGPWPLDAVFFRWQGLCSDFGLLITFIRLYFSTKNQLKAFGDPNLHDKLLKHQQRVVDENVAAIAAQNAAASTEASTSTAAARPSVPQDHEQLNALERIKKHLVAKAPAPEEARRQQQQSQEQQNDQEARHSESRPSRRQRLTRLFSDDSPSSSDSSEDEGDRGLVQNPFHRSNGATAGQNGSARPSHDQATNGHGNGAVATTVNMPSCHARPQLSVADIVQQSSVEWGVKWHNPEQIVLLIGAAFFHVAGNVTTTIWTQSVYALAFFQISYGLSFPLYAYYLYVDNHALRQTKVYLPKFSVPYLVIYGALSILCSTLTIRLGLFVAAKAAEGTTPTF